MNCKICDGKVSALFTAKVLNKYDADYVRCESCGFVFPDNPHWLEEAYKNALNVEDTGVLMRNLRFRNALVPLLVSMFGQSGKFLDWGGGYGVFTRLMRDKGLDFYWDDKYAKNIFAQGFEYSSDLKIDAITTFEVFEHLEFPIAEIEKMLKISDTIIFSTDIISDIPPKPQDWWYYSFQHGQHIALYSRKSLLKIGEKYGLNYYSNGYNLHMLSKKKKFPLWVKLMMKAGKYGLSRLLLLNSKTLSDSNMLAKARE